MTFLEPILDQLLSNPLYIVIAGVIAVFIAIGIIKKLIKVLAVLTIALVLFLGFLQVTGRDLPTDSDALKAALDNVIETASGNIDLAD